MSLFDTVQLEPIEDPIPPESTFEWQPIALIAGGILLFVGVGIALLYGLKWARRKYSNRKLGELKSMRQALKQFVKGNVTAENLDVDKWWRTLHQHLLHKGWISDASLSFEELTGAVEQLEAVKFGLRQNLSELIDLVEEEKYKGKPDIRRRERMLELFVKLYQEFVSPDHTT